MCFQQILNVTALHRYLASTQRLAPAFENVHKEIKKKSKSNFQYTRLSTGLV